jgi:hypothetical protein
MRQDNVQKFGIATDATNDNTIQHMHFARWITKATDTIRICNRPTYYFHTATMVSQMHFNVTLDIHCLFFLISRI